MKPLYKWPGGKSSEIEIIKENIPNHFNVYIEPFFGGGSLFFYLQNHKNVINEINSEVFIFLNLIKQGRGIDIYESLNTFSNDEDTYYKVRDWNPDTDLEKAVRFYYLRKTCFRGLARYNSSGKFNVPYGNYKTFKIDELLNEDYVSLLQNTIIMNKDFNEVFNHYDSKDDFCFLDPPYHNTFSNYTSDGFDDKKHIELSNRFKESNMKCLMVIGKTELIKELYKDYIIQEYSKKYSITRVENKNHVKDSPHLIIRNY